MHHVWHAGSCADAAKEQPGLESPESFRGCLSAGAPSRMRVRPRLPPGQPWPFACLCLLECLILWHPRMAWVSHSSVVTGESPLSTAATSKGLKVEAARPSEECRCRHILSVKALMSLEGVEKQTPVTDEGVARSRLRKA